MVSLYSADDANSVENTCSSYHIMYMYNVYMVHGTCRKVEETKQHMYTQSAQTMLKRCWVTISTHVSYYGWIKNPGPCKVKVQVY